MMRRFFHFAIITVLVVTVFYGRDEIARTVRHASEMISPEQEKESLLPVIDELLERNRDVSVPGPLISAGTEVETSGSSDALSKSGIIAHTNKERTREGLPALRENALLASAAERKVEDMFALQYFEHDSPTGVGVGDLGERVGYSFVLIGENLALGNFGGDAQVVAAWMASPGHRDNIVNSRFTEIGVAAAEGMYKGQRVWMAVQHFGKPLSSCPSISQSLKASIEINHFKIKDLEQVLLALREEIEGMSAALRPGYEERVEAFNALVVEFNALAKKTQTDIAIYNAQVAAFNACTQ